MRFLQLKALLNSQPVLVIPNDHDQFRVEANASDFAVDAVLSQCQDDKWKLVAYRSQALQEAECNYEIYDKEMLAIMTALKE